MKMLPDSEGKYYPTFLVTLHELSQTTRTRLDITPIFLIPARNLTIRLKWDLPRSPLRLIYFPKLLKCLL